MWGGKQKQKEYNILYLLICLSHFVKSLIIYVEAANELTKKTRSKDKAS